MGMWFDYTIQFANKESGNLVEKLIQKRILEEDSENTDSVWVNLKMLNKEVFKDGYHNDGLERIRIGRKEDGSLFYVNKWFHDQRLAFEFSRHLNDVFFISEESDYGDQNFWYEKNGNLCTRSGKDVKSYIFAIKMNLVSMKGNGYKVRLPIGNEPNKWGTVYLKEECVVHHRSLEDDPFSIDSPVAVFFDKERIPVYFRSGKVEMDTTEIKNRYLQSKIDYRHFANQPVILEVPCENVSAKTMRDGSTFFIITIPCTQDRSSNNEMTFATSLGSVRDTREGAYLVNVGPQFSSHRVYYEENGRHTTEHIKNCQIADIFKEGIKHCLCSESVKNQTHANENTFYTCPKITAEILITQRQQEGTEEDIEEKELF